jgi:hypothetical protein
MVKRYELNLTTTFPLIMFYSYLTDNTNVGEEESENVVLAL